jgi:hypothetical protein
VASVPPRRKQKGAERHTVNELGENRFFASLWSYFSFIPLVFDFSFSIIRVRVITTSQGHLLPLMTSTKPRTPSSDSSDSSGSSESNLSYTHEEALAFLKGRDEAQEELGNISKQFGIEQAEWEDQRKQFCDAIFG